VSPFLAATLVAAAAVFVAEFGDKSQLLILAFATRMRAAPVITGLVVAAACVQGLSVLVGSAVGAILPGRLVAIVSGIAFLAVAAWTLHGDGDADEDGAALTARTTGGGRPTFLAMAVTVAAAFVLSELGDKTMLVTFGLAAEQGTLPTWIGSALGEVTANLVAIAVGRQLGRRLSPRAVRIGSAILFALAGLAIVVGALLES
jgi:putative Ca2+/H+ antiporter (TMEM165/GDT1 family)